MARTGTATLPLHTGRTPRWLFERMTALSQEVVRGIVTEFGPHNLLRRLSDPHWFQAFGCVLGFDWHSSGLTTTVTGALKEGLRGLETELGVFVAGGKGAASRKAPAHIRAFADKEGIDAEPLVYASRMSAKVDNTALQDGYQLYHHVMIFTTDGQWAVVQQGMNECCQTARRYHWLGEGVKDFVVEPHNAVCCDRRDVTTLNLVASESEGVRQICAQLSRLAPGSVTDSLADLDTLELPHRHKVTLKDIDRSRLYRILIRSYEQQPADFKALLGLTGIGPKTLRALSLVSELIYGETPSCKDPARFSFAHGGKDGTPFPVDRKTYDETIDVMARAIRSAQIGNEDKLQALRRLGRVFEEKR